jgi:hypothetical protein
MPTGRVKVFHADRNFGFLTTTTATSSTSPATRSRAARSAPATRSSTRSPTSDNGKRAATGVTVTKQAPADNPVGRTMAPPPSWDELEERERQRRMARRRRR